MSDMFYYQQYNIRENMSEVARRLKNNTPRLYCINRSPARPKLFHLIMLGSTAVLILFMSIG